MNRCFKSLLPNSAIINFNIKRGGRDGIKVISSFDVLNKTKNKTKSFSTQKVTL